MESKSRYRICRTLEEINKVIEYCLITHYCSFDFESKARGPHGPSIDEDAKPNGPQYREDEPTVVSLSFQPGSSFCVPLFHKESPFSRNEAFSIIHIIGIKIMENPNVVKIAWNLKFEYKWFWRYGHRMVGRLLDGMGMKYFVDEERPMGLKEFVSTHMPEFDGYEKEVRTLFIRYKGWENIPLKKLAKYCCMDSDLTFRAVVFLERLVVKEGHYKLFRNMFMMQTRVIAESEQMGIPIDRPYLNELIKTWGKKIQVNLKKVVSHERVRIYQKWRIRTKIKMLITQVNDEIEAIQKEGKPNAERLIKNRQEKISRYIAGNLVSKKEKVGDFNPNSPDQMVSILFTSPKGFNFPVFKFTKDDNKQDTERPSTDEEVLLHLKKKDKSGFLQQVLNHREMVKLHSTYMVGVEYRLTQESILNGSFLIHGTVTGRLSSKNPNLQNIPRTVTSSVIKKMYICPPHHLLLEVDYGQAELRVAAEMSGDKALIDIFKRGYNVHVATGAKINKQFERYDEIKGILSNPDHPKHIFWEKQKKRGKVLNFSILYLQSDEMTANQMECSVKEAKYFKDAWFEEFSGIQPMFEKQEEYVKEHGYVVNLFGRKRRLPGIYDGNQGIYNQAVRQSINAPIQGASSDFTQFASISIREQILKGDLILTDDKKYWPQTYTVHDSLGYYIMPKYIHKAVPVIEKICSDPETMKYFGFEMQHVKMKVSPEIGINWGSLQDYKKEEDYTKLLQS